MSKKTKDITCKYDDMCTDYPKFCENCVNNVGKRSYYRNKDWNFPLNTTDGNGGGWYPLIYSSTLVDANSTNTRCPICDLENGEHCLSVHHCANNPHSGAIFLSCKCSRCSPGF